MSTEKTSTTQEKLVVSQAWTVEERNQVIQRVEAQIQLLKSEEAEMRITIRWEAPCLQKNHAKRKELQQLIRFLHKSTSDFLQLNRVNFSEYVTI